MAETSSDPERVSQEFEKYVVCPHFSSATAWSSVGFHSGDLLAIALGVGDAIDADGVGEGVVAVGLGEAVVGSGVAVGVGVASGLGACEHAASRSDKPAAMMAARRLDPLH